MKHFKKILLPLSLLVIVPLTAIPIVACSQTPNKDNINQPSPPPIPPQSPAELSPLGGEVNGLKVSAYKDIAKQLNLQPTTFLSSWSNEQLNAKLHENQDYQKLSLAIQDGSNEEQGKLSLKLTGQCYDKPINADMTITGFKIPSEQQKLEVVSVILNKQKYFDLKQPIKESTNLEITKDLNQKISLIEDAKFTINNSENISLKDFGKRFTIDNLNIIRDQNNLVYNFTLKEILHTYKNGQWTNQKEIAIIQNSNHKPSSLIPTFNDLKIFMLNALVLNKEAFKTYYPSYFKGMLVISKQIGADRTGIINKVENFDEIINKYKPTYFANKNFELIANWTDPDSLLADDATGYLKFNVSLVDLDDDTNFSTNRNFELNNLKTILTLLETQKNKDNLIAIKNTDTSKLANSIKRVYKSDIKSLFDKAQPDQVLNLDKAKIAYSLKNWTTIYHEGLSLEKNGQLATAINESYALSILGAFIEDGRFSELNGNFNQYLDQAVFDYSTGLFSNKWRDYNCFQLEYVVLNFDNATIQASMSQNTNLVTISIDADMEIGLNSAENKVFKQKTKLSLHITRSSFNKL